ncbi:hypothetical protein PTNB73_04773 [Pyrenophora teres f. teres]|nr:hypothetical protein HRS9122_03494 [Pyrenophora teres f. teres]KAE8866679.1 hypothetical protein PTNB73_04773 [Pyrenophora teres f. teres]
MTEAKTSDLFFGVFKNCVDNIIKALPPNMDPTDATATSAIRIIASQINHDHKRLQHVVQTIQARIFEDAVWASSTAVNVYELLAASIDPQISHPDIQMTTITGSLLTCTVGNMTSTAPKITLDIIGCMLGSESLTKDENFDIFVGFFMRAGPFLDGLGYRDELTVRVEKLVELSKSLRTTEWLAIYGLLQLREKGWQMEEEDGGSSDSLLDGVTITLIMGCRFCIDTVCKRNAKTWAVTHLTVLCCALTQHLALHFLSSLHYSHRKVFSEMAAHTVSDDVTVRLTEDVYQDQFEWAAMVNDVADSIDSGTSENTAKDLVKLLLSMVGRDLIKLHRLVQVVQEKIEMQSTWATTAAAKFYCALFDSIDPNLELDVSIGDRLLGARIVIKYILDISGDFVNRSDWGIEPSAVLKLTRNLLDRYSFNGQDASAAGLLAHGLLERMSQSTYLFFADNFDVFARFAYVMVPILDAAERSGKSERVNSMLKALKKADYERTELQNFRIEGLYICLERSNLYRKHNCIPPIPEWVPGVESVQEMAIRPKVEVSLSLFATMPDWKHPSISRMIRDASQAMRIDAPRSIQTATLDMIQAMVQCEHLLSHKNLQTLLQFIFSVAPTLDAMAETSQCSRLTSLLDELRDSPTERTIADSCDIEDLRRNLGRAYRDVMASSSSEQVGEGAKEEGEVLESVSQPNVSG